MAKLFSFIKVLLLVFIGIAILNDVFTYLYVAFVWGSPSGFVGVAVEVVFFILSGIFIYRDQYWGNIILVILNAWSLQNSYALNHTFFDPSLISFAPQVLFSNILTMALLIVAIIHFILLLMRKTKNRPVP